MNSLHGARITCVNSDSSSRIHWLKVVMNLIAEFDHRRHARRRIVVNSGSEKPTVKARRIKRTRSSECGG
jgi:hypothetical protein